MRRAWRPLKAEQLRWPWLRGAAAIAYTIQNLAHAGEHIVAAKTIYGGTYNLLAHTMDDFGVTTTFVEPDAPENLKRRSMIRRVPYL